MATFTNKQRSAQELHAGGIVSQIDRTYLIENFTKKPGLNADMIIDPDADDAGALAAYTIANKDFEILGTNASSADVTFSPGGGILAETDGGSNDQIIVLPHLDTNQTAWSGTNWNTNDEVRWGCIIETAALVDDLTIWAGLKLTNTSVTATDDDQCFFRSDEDTNGGRFQLIASRAGTDTATDSQLAATAASTRYKLEISIDSDRVPSFFINGSHLFDGAALTADIDLIPYIGVQNTDTTAKSIHIRKQWISKEMNN